MRVLMTTKCTSRVSAALVVVCCVALIGLGGNAQASLVGWWNLDDGLADNTTTTAADSSPTPAGGSANDGVLRNYPDPTLNWNQGLTGATDGITMPHGLLFDGYANQNVGDTPDGQHVDLDAHTSDFTALTKGAISIWFRREISGNDRTLDHALIGFGRPEDNNYMRIIVDTGDQSSGYQDTLQGTEAVDGGTANSITQDFDDDGNWHNVVWMSDGLGNANSSSLYLDGVLQGTSDQGFLSVPVSQMALGFTDRGNRPLWYYDGTMGDVRIYDDILSQAQLRYLADPQYYGDGLALPEPASAALLLLGSVGLLAFRRRGS